MRAERAERENGIHNQREVQPHVARDAGSVRIGFLTLALDGGEELVMSTVVWAEAGHAPS